MKQQCVVRRARARIPAPARTLDSVPPLLPLSATFDSAHELDAIVPVLTHLDQIWQGKCTMDNSTLDRYSDCTPCVVSEARTKICTSCF